jgi:Tol biopolymer transport system component
MRGDFSRQVVIRALKTLAPLALLLSLLGAACSGNESPSASGTATLPPAAATEGAGLVTATPATSALSCSGRLFLPPGNSNDVFLLSFTGSQAQISPSLGSGWIAPTLSPDGTRVAFYMLQPSPEGSEDAGLYVADADGRNVRRLADVTRHHDQNAPVWAPRSDKIAFESARATGWGEPVDVYVVKADGTGLINLTKGAVWGNGPTWSPDGSKLALSAWELAGDVYGQAGDVHVVNADGSALQRLSTGAATSASWSPDGSLLAFVSYRDLNAEVYVMRPDGSGQTNITRNPAGEFPAIQGSPPLAWSPDGKKLAFLTDRDPDLNIYAVNADGSGLTRITRDSAAEFNPRWSSDSRCLTFYSSRPSPSGGMMEVFLVGADGSGLSRLTTLR